MQSVEKDPNHYLCLVSTEPLSNVHNPPICKGKIIKHKLLVTRKDSFTSNQKRYEVSYNNEPKYVLPVRTAKQRALSTSLCWCNKGSKSLCSIIPERTWYLSGKSDS